MKTPNVGDVVTVVDYDRTVRAKVAKSYKRRFIVEVEHKLVRYIGVVGTQRSGTTKSCTVHYSFERSDEGRTWVRGWDDETAIAFRTEKALAACR